MLREGLVMGIVGTVLGFPVGMAGAHYLQTGMAAIPGSPTPTNPSRPDPAVAGRLAGPRDDVGGHVLSRQDCRPNLAHPSDLAPWCRVGEGVSRCA